MSPSAGVVVAVVIVIVVIRNKVRQSISRERFGLESQNFTNKTFTPVGYTPIPDLTSLTTSGWQLSEFKQDARQLVGQAKRRAAKIRAKAVGRGFSADFRRNRPRFALLE